MRTIDTVTIGVPDVRVWMERLARCGIETSGLDMIPGVIARCSMRDPYGHYVSLYELLD